MEDSKKNSKEKNREISNSNLIPHRKGDANTGGRPLGSLNKSTMLKRLLADGDTEIKMHKAMVEAAINGNTKAYELVTNIVYGPTVSLVDINANISTFNIRDIYNITPKEEEEDEQEYT